MQREGEIEEGYLQKLEEVLSQLEQKRLQANLHKIFGMQTKRTQICWLPTRR